MREATIRDKTRSVQDVVRRLKNGTIRLNPDMATWKAPKQSRFIESMLLRIPTTAIYVYENVSGVLEPIDGFNRLVTIEKFMLHRMQLKLKLGNQFDKKYFLDLDIRMQNRIEDYQLIFYIIDYTTSREDLAEIAKRIR